MSACAAQILQETGRLFPFSPSAAAVRRESAGMILANLAFLAALLAAHPTSVSSTRVDVAGARVEARIRCQEQTLRECVPLDADGSGRIEARELDAGRPALERYVLSGWRLADGDGAPLAGRVEQVAFVRDSSPTEVDVVLRFDAGRDLTGITIDFALFRESDPLHRDHCEIAWNGAEPAGRLMWVEDPVWRFDTLAEANGTSALDVFGAFVHHGVEHILFGFDHVAFVVALVLGARRLRPVLVVVTAFTLAHSVSLALAAFEVVVLPASVVEPAIALSIAWVAARNLWSRGARTPWIEAFVFGLVHGLGFAGAIGATLASEPRKLSALAGFNLGVEAGQVAVVGALLLASAAARAVARGAESSPESAEDGSGESKLRWVSSAASLAVAVLGVYWFVERVGS